MGGRCGALDARSLVRRVLVIADPPATRLGPPLRPDPQSYRALCLCGLHGAGAASGRQTACKRAQEVRMLLACGGSVARRSLVPSTVQSPDSRVVLSAVSCGLPARECGPRRQPGARAQGVGERGRGRTAPPAPRRHPTGEDEGVSAVRVRGGRWRCTPPPPRAPEPPGAHRHAMAG